jgi:chromate reductase, NAD(P)H dehydrogenase (quinone)
VCIKIMLVSGSLRAASLNTAVVRTATRVAVPGIRASTYDELGALPYFNPDLDIRSDPVVRALQERLRAVDGVVLCAPEYAGCLPGAFKNLLDWMTAGGELYGMPVAWIHATSRPAGERQSDGAYDSLRRVLGYAGAVLVESICAQVRITDGAVGEDGLIEPKGLQREIANVVSAMRDHCASLPASTASPLDAPRS